MLTIDVENALSSPKNPSSSPPKYDPSDRLVTTSSVPLMTSTMPSWIKYIFVPIVPRRTTMSPGWNNSWRNLLTTWVTKFGSAFVKNGTELTSVRQLKLTISYNSSKMSSHISIPQCEWNIDYKTASELLRAISLWSTAMWFLNEIA